jgi:hypothetical protein
MTMQPYALFSGPFCIATGPDVATGRRLKTPGQMLLWGEAAEGFTVAQREPVAAVPALEAPKVPAELPAFLDGPGDARPMPRVMRQEVSRLQGYTGDDCQTCGQFTMVRNGTCLKCDSCGATSGCS